MKTTLTFLNGAAYMALVLISLYAYDQRKGINKTVNQQVAFNEQEDYLTALTKGRK